jgi:multiple sugar transport system permease protein
MAQHANRIRRSVRRTGFYLLLAVVVAPFLGVFLYMVKTSVESTVQITTPGLHLIFRPTLANYRSVFGQNDILAFARNSFIIAGASTLIALLLGAPAAFALVYYRLRRITVVILLSRVTPGITLLLPWFVLFARLNWVDTYRALVLAHLVINLPLVIWMLTNFFQDVPRELIESARVDGASIQRAFLSVALPTVRAGAAAVGILAFILSWNNFLLSVVLAINRTRTLPVAAFNFLSYGNVEWGAISAVAVIMTVPVAVLALLAQRQIIAGLSARIEI